MVWEIIYNGRNGYINYAGIKTCGSEPSLGPYTIKGNSVGCNEINAVSLSYGNDRKSFFGSGVRDLRTVGPRAVSDCAPSSDVSTYPKNYLHKNASLK